MTVTQEQIDDALVLINDTWYNTSTAMMKDYQKGCKPCDTDTDLLYQLFNCKNILVSGLDGVANEWFTDNDLWLTIQLVDTLASC